MQKNIIKNSFKYSLERSVPILIGFFPVGTMYGLMMSAVNKKLDVIKVKTLSQACLSTQARCRC